MEPFRIGGLSAWRHEAMDASGELEPWGRLLLVHGLGEHSGRYEDLVGALTRAGIEVVRFDLRGSGQSDGERMWIDRFSDYTDDTFSVASWISAHLKPLPLFLFGHSLGGAIAIRFAAEHGDILKGLILSAPALRPGRGVSRWKIALGRALVGIAPHRRIPDTLEVKAISRDPQVVEAYRKDPLNCRFNTLRQGNEILNALDGLLADCAKIRLPVLIVHGDADRIIKPEGSHELINAFAGTDKTLRKYLRGYHELHNDLEKEKYFDGVVDWLRAHRSAKAPG